MREAVRGLFVGGLADAEALPALEVPISHVLSLCGLSPQAEQAIRQWQAQGGPEGQQRLGPGHGLGEATPKRLRGGRQTGRWGLRPRRKGWAVHRRPAVRLKIFLSCRRQPEDSCYGDPQAANMGTEKGTENLATDRASVQLHHHLQVDLLDMASANLLDLLPRCLDFINGALGARHPASGPGSSKLPNTRKRSERTGDNMTRGLGCAVLIHCHAGVSRRSHVRKPASAVLFFHPLRCRRGLLTVRVVACYLSAFFVIAMDCEWPSCPDALRELLSKVPEAAPNSGFMRQLALFQAMGNLVDKRHPLYKAFRLSVSRHSLDFTDTPGRGTEDHGSNVEDGAGKRSIGRSITKGSDKEEREFRCRKCLTALASSANCVPHLDHPTAPLPTTLEDQTEVPAWPDLVAGGQHHAQVLGASTAGSQPSTCSGVFIEPLRWMFPSTKNMESMPQEGKLYCFNCSARVGSFTRVGVRCSCGAWVSPAFQLHYRSVESQVSWNCLRAE